MGSEMCIRDSTKHKIRQYVPGTKSIFLEVSRCQDYSFTPSHLSHAISIFTAEYAKTHDMTYEEVSSKLAGLTIEVSIIPKVLKNVYDIDGKFISEPIGVTGLAISKNRIWVEVKTSKIFDSALFHELVHVIIWRENIVHGDPDHEGDQFSGWTKKHTLMLKRLKHNLMDLDL